MLRQIRDIALLNRFFRNLIRSLLQLLNRLTFKWRTSGVVDFTFRGKHIVFFTQSDDGIADALFYERDYIEYSELTLFSYLAERSKTIADIGANTGLYSIISAKSNPQANIIGFEPNPSNLVRLKKNIALNQVSNIRIEEQAVGDTAGTVSFTIPADGSISDTSSVLGDFSKATYQGKIQWKEITVPQTSLNDFFSGAQVDLVKIDVEGYEVSVFNGAVEFFKKNKPVILCEIFLDDEKKCFFDKFLSDNNYHPYLILKDGLLRLDEGLIPNYDGLNFLFSKNKTRLIYNSFKNIESVAAELL
jgi:FkbM family methyltransferase